MWEDSTCSHSLALIRVVQPHDPHSHPPPSPRLIRAPTSRSNSLDARTHRFSLLTPNKKKRNKKCVNHCRLSRSSVVWSHGEPPSDEPGPSFGRNTSFCTLYSARPWRTVQLGFYSECQGHQPLGSSLQKSGIFSCFLSKFSQYFHMALGCLLLVSKLITVLPLVMHSQCISCWRDTWAEFTLVASMHNMMNLNVCKHIVPVLRLVWAFQTAPNTLAFFRHHLRTLRVQH